MDESTIQKLEDLNRRLADVASKQATRDDFNKLAEKISQLEEGVNRLYETIMNER